MENASKALLMAGGVLLGLMILSVGVALYSSFGSSGTKIVSQIEKTHIAEFNNIFLKDYVAYDPKDENSKFVGITAHDVVTLVNFVEKNNEYYDLVDEVGHEGINYVRIDFNNIVNFEKKEVRRQRGYEPLTKFLQDNSEVEYEGEEDEKLMIKPYYISLVEVSSITGRVWHVVIREK